MIWSVPGIGAGVHQVLTSLFHCLFVKRGSVPSFVIIIVYTFHKNLCAFLHDLQYPKAGLHQSVTSPAAVFERWSWTVAWVLSKQQKTGGLMLILYTMVLRFVERWGPGCGDCSLVNSGRTRAKGLTK